MGRAGAGFNKRAETQVLKIRREMGGLKRGLETGLFEEMTSLKLCCDERSCDKRGSVFMFNAGRIRMDVDHARIPTTPRRGSVQRFRRLGCVSQG